MNRVDVVELMDGLEKAEVPYLMRFKGEGVFELSIVTYPGVRLTEEQSKEVLRILGEMKLTWEPGLFGVQVL